MYTFSANTIIDSAKVNSNFQSLADGTGVETSVNMDQMRKDTMFAHIVSGLVPSFGTLTTTITAGVYVDHNGKRWEVAAASKLLTANRDTYIDLYEGTYYYTSVTNGATSGMTLTADYFRVAKVVTDATSITSVVQYDDDPLYNRIGNHNSNVLVTTAFDNSGSSQTITATGAWQDITNASGTVKVVRGKMLVVTAKITGYKSSVAGGVGFRLAIDTGGIDLLSNIPTDYFVYNTLLEHTEHNFEWHIEGNKHNGALVTGNLTFKIQCKPDASNWQQDTNDRHKLIVKEYA